MIKRLKDKLLDKIEKAIYKLSHTEIFLSEKDKIAFLKISRWICIVLWLLSLVKFFNDASTTVPLLTFTALILILTYFIPEDERIP